ncbi:MAG TPA: DUF6624 domain-containing protein [Gemmatimonadaceae bacterium]|nr:DUF6624 domain-containing protein [Gemmatimonadaceae bacterium]
MNHRWLAVAWACAPLCAANGQGFAETMMRANGADSVGDHARAAALYEQAYGVSGFDPVVLAVAAQSAAEAGMTDRALRDLGRAIDQGVLEPRLMADTAFWTLRADRRWKALDARMHRKLAAVDQPLRTELLRLADRDQRNRAGIGAVLTKYGVKSPQGDSAMRAMTAADAPIQAKVRKIIAQHGWPGRALVADDGAHAAWLVVQHMPHAYQARVLALLRAAGRAGDARAGDVALLEDRVLVGSHRRQRYGTQLTNPPAGGPPSLDPIAHEQCVDQRRRRVGLEPLAEYLKGFGVTYHPVGTCPAGATRAHS